MSLNLLLEKYDVSTDEGLQKALNEIEKEEAEVDEALTGVLSRACTLEGRLRTASQAYAKLGEVKNDARSAAEMIDKTAGLARDVSAKVRQLDLARSRVAECQRRVHDLIDLQLCSAGVEAAIKAHDYETGAVHVARFLSMAPGSVAAARAHGVPDAMARAAQTLREHLVRKFEEAARKEDEAAVERLFKLFPQIGCAEEGVGLLAKYLAKQAESSIRKACSVGESSADVAAFAGTFSRVLEAAAATLEKARRIAPGYFASAFKDIQPTICKGVRRLYAEMVSARRLEGSGARDEADPRGVEPLVTELAAVQCTLHMYLAFVRRKCQMDITALDEEAKKEIMARVEKTITQCDLMRVTQDILNHYLTMERFFLEESVNKALKMSVPQAGVTTSSLVDDVFFIARRVIKRGASTRSVDGLCCVLNEVGGVLERVVAPALRRVLRSPPLDPLPLAPPPAQTPSSDTAAAAAAAAALLTQRLNRDVDAQRALYLAHTTEAESGAEWSERLATEAMSEAERSGCVRSATERDKLASCALGLGAAAAAFRAARDLALSALSAAAAPRVAAWAAALVRPLTDSEDMEEGMDAEALPTALEALSEAARESLPARAVDSLLAALVADVATKAETKLMHHTYDIESGLAVERRLRRLSTWAGAWAAASRDRCARAVAAAALLSAERAQLPALVHAHHALAPRDVANIISRRADFNPEDLKRLKL